MVIKTSLAGKHKLKPETLPTLRGLDPWLHSRLWRLTHVCGHMATLPGLIVWPGKAVKAWADCTASCVGSTAKD